MKLTRVAMFVVVGAALFAGVRGCRSNAGARYAAARARVQEACRAYRAEPEHADAEVCRRHDELAPSALVTFGLAKAKVEDARSSLALHDAAAAERALVSAMASTHEMQRRQTILGEMCAAWLAARVLDVIDAHPDQLDAHARAAILAGADLDQVAHPFDTARLQTLWELAHHDEDARAPSMSVRALADAMELDGGVFDEMDEAIGVLDVPRCAREARRLEPDDAAKGGVMLCSDFGRMVGTAKRLDLARAANR